MRKFSQKAYDAAKAYGYRSGLEKTVEEDLKQFTVADRRKHLLVQKQHPELDIRFVFASSKRRLSKVSKTTYAEWCEKYNFLYADKKIPEQWTREAPKKIMPLEFNPYKGTKHE